MGRSRELSSQSGTKAIGIKRETKTHGVGGYQHWQSARLVSSAGIRQVFWKEFLILPARILGSEAGFLGSRISDFDVKELAILTSRIGQSWSPGLEFHRLGRSQAIAAWRPAVSNEDLTEGEKRTKRQKLSEHYIGLLRNVDEPYRPRLALRLLLPLIKKNKSYYKKKPPEANSWLQ